MSRLPKAFSVIGWIGTNPACGPRWRVFIGAGPTWRDTHAAGVGVLVDCIVTAAGRQGQHDDDWQDNGRCRVLDRPRNLPTS
jgi:hypothetical protein